MKVLKQNGQALQKIYDRNTFFRKKHIEEKVKRILDDVRQNGDTALLKYTKRFDGASLSAKDLRVSEAEISGAYQGITSDFITDLKVIINNVSLFYKKQKQKPASIRNEEGVMLKEKITPLETVGVYIPAGTAPLISTVYMTVLPAKIAGVKNIYIATPPNKEGHINPHILAVANLLKVDTIFKMGGAQAIAALAYGTKTIPKVDKIVGPGNIFVTEAKRQLFGHVDIDMLAGPSELVIIANRHSNPNYIVADLEAQIEHLDGLGILVTTSKQLIKQIRHKVPNAYAVFAKNCEEAIEITNKIAPEHLQIMTNNARSVATKIKNAGAIFLGPYSPTALGDYAAGPSHVLPTLGTAKFFSGLSLEHFQKKSHLISYSKKALEKMRGPIVKVASLEHLTKHAESIKVRFE